MLQRRHGWGETAESDGDLASHRHTNGALSSGSTHSGVFADVDDGDHQGQGNKIADQKLLENARFGLAKVNLRSGKSSTRRASAAMGQTAFSVRLHNRSSSVAYSWIERLKQRPWKSTFTQIANILRLLDSIYILISVPLRLGFFFDPWNDVHRRTTWSLALSMFTTLDLLGVLIRLWFARTEFLPRLQRALRHSLACCLRRVHPSDKPRLLSVLRASFIGDGDMMSFRSQLSGLSGRGDRVSAVDALPYRQRSKISQRLTFRVVLSSVFNCLPLEIVVIAMQNYNFLHLVSLTRYAQAFQTGPRLFSDVVFVRLRHFQLIQALSFSSIAAIVALFVIGVYLVHVASSGYMLLAHIECGIDFDMCLSSPILPGTWVQRDRLEGGSLWRKYIRSLYWGSKTVTTLGQGDLVPATLAETAYRNQVQFVSGLWATAILTAYSFYFSRKDSKMTTNLTTRLEQATKFLASRRVPSALANKVQTYFEYMQRTRVGVEEELALQGLPSHYHVQCLNYVKYRSLQRLPLFRHRDGAFLRSVLSCLEKDYYAPGQTVVSVGDAEEMFVVAKGEINVLDANGGTISRLAGGNAYAETALFSPRTAVFTLVAATHCEVWILHQDDFKAALKQHFSKLKYAGIMTSTHAKVESTHRLNSAKFDMALVAEKFKVHDHHTGANKLLRKLSNSSQAPNASVEKTSDSWRMPNSRFQRTWKHVKCALLVLQLYEVPYQIAFQRGFGLGNGADSPVAGAIPHEIQVLNFWMTVLMEFFFYADWAMRARFFYRYVVDNDAGDNGDNASFGLLTEASMIFRHYRENENVVLDCIQNLPLPLVWDIIPKDAFSSSTVYTLRFVRLFRFVRLHQLHAILRALMIDHALSPSKRLLVYVVIFCTSSAHIAACIFFLLGDKSSFRGGLPVGGVLPDSTTAFDCLQHATLFQNCTWYMYDRSTYNIDAPFLRALQWSIVLQSTVGYGEIMSFSTRECFIGCLWIFLGANICYCVGCVLSSILGQLDIHNTIRHERMEEINLALQSAPNITEDTKVLIRSYYDTKWELNGCARRDREILGNLPRSLRLAVREALFIDDLRSCYLFAEDTTSPCGFVRELAHVTRSEIFLKNVMVVREGQLATEFFVIQRGEVELLLAPLAMPVADAESRPKKENTQRLRRQVSAAVTSAWANVDKSGSLTIVPRSSNARLYKGALASFSTSMRESISSSRGSAIYSRAMRMSAVDLRLPLLRRQTQPETRQPFERQHIPISILKRHDCFGEESIAPMGSARTYQVNVRVVATAHLAVIDRNDLVGLASRFPGEFSRIFALIRSKAKQDDVLFKSLGVNFMFKDRIARRLGIPKSLYVDRTKLLSSIGSSHRISVMFSVIDPETAFARWWYRVVSTILVYNFYFIIFRLAFLPNPSGTAMVVLTAIDYICDAILYADIFLKHGRIGYIEHGEKIMNRPCIRERYVDSWFKQDCWSMLPTFYVGDYFIMTVCRLPRLLRSRQLQLILDDAHSQIIEHFLRGNKTKLSSVFDLFRFVLIFLSTAHYVGSLYYLLGRLQLEWGIVEKSWVNVDFILLQYPDNVWVHYMRALYWCLSTFTVDCFGDIVARNFLETLYSMSTCILGWIFIGQVIGRINVLMITLDKEAKQRQVRIEDFDQYATQRKLPHAMRVRALCSLSFKSECLVPLRLSEIFADLPKPLQMHLFNDMYAPLLRRLREFEELTQTQLAAIASALRLEIYLPGDIIYECGRTGTMLYLMQQGCAEVYAPRGNIVFAAIETGALFGECAFFIPGAKRLASARAVRSCQVLQLHRRQWMRLWPDSLRVDIETKVRRVVTETYRDNARAYLNMTKYFYVKNENVKPPRSLSQRTIFQRSRPALSRRASKVVKEPEPTTTSANSPQHHRTSFSGMLLGFVSLSRPPSPPASAALGPLDHATLTPRDKLVRQDSADTSFRGSSSFKFSRSNKGDAPAVSAPSSLQRQSSSSSSVSHSPGERVPSRRPSATAGADSRVPSRRPSTASAGDSPRRKSSITAFAEALGVQLKQRPTSGVGRLPPLTTVPSDRVLVKRASKRGGFMPKLSAATQLKWKYYEKRLAAIRMFRVAFARVENDLAVVTGGTDPSKRRASISVVPTITAAIDEKRSQLRTRTVLRRHSIQVDETSLLKELLAFDGFENEDAAHGLRNAQELDSSENIEDDDADATRANTSNDSSGSFTLSTFLVELTVGQRRSMRRTKKSRVAPMGSATNRSGASYEIWVPPRPGPEMFQENSRFRQTWDSIMLLVTVYYAIVIPFRACFLHDHMDDPRFRLAVIATFALEYVLTDIPCVLDFVLRRHHFEYTEDGETVSEPTRIASHYWHEGTFLVDLLSLVPVEVIAVGITYLPGETGMFSAGFFTPEDTAPVWRALAFGRVNRALRALVHLHYLSDRVQRFVLYDLKVSWLRPSLCYVVRLGIDFALGTHWISCLFFGASYLLHAEDHPSWLTTPGMLVFDESSSRLEDVSRVPVLTKYLRSFHFSIGAVTTVCYGDILPMNALENLVTIVVIFLSVGLFSMLSGGFFKYFEMELGKRADYEEKVSQVGQLMVFHQFPSRMWKQMQVFFALSWQESKGMHEEEMLRGLTRSMRNEIARHVHQNLLQHVKILNSCDAPFARALLTVLQHELYVRNDVIIQRGDRGRSMYIIESGLVSIRRPETKRHRPSSTATSVKPTNEPGRLTSSNRLRGSKLIIRDLKTAALAAAESAARAAPKTSFVPTSPSHEEMLHEMRKASQDHTELNPNRALSPSPTLKLKVAPKLMTRSASGILAPDSAAAVGGEASAATASARTAAPVAAAAPRPPTRDAEGNDVRFVKGAFDYFGERSLLFGTPRMATCVALCVCSVYVLTLEQYERLLEQFPAARRKNIQDWVLADRKQAAGGIR